MTVCVCRRFHPLILMLTREKENDVAVSENNSQCSVAAFISVCTILCCDVGRGFIWQKSKDRMSSTMTTLNVRYRWRNLKTNWHSFTKQCTNVRVHSRSRIVRIRLCIQANAKRSFSIHSIHADIYVWTVIGFPFELPQICSECKLPPQYTHKIADDLFIEKFYFCAIFFRFSFLVLFVHSCHKFVLWQLFSTKKYFAFV